MHYNIGSKEPKIFMPFVRTEFAKPSFASPASILFWPQSAKDFNVLSIIAYRFSSLAPFGSAPRLPIVLAGTDVAWRAGHLERTRKSCPFDRTRRQHLLWSG